MTQPDAPQPILAESRKSTLLFKENVSVEPNFPLHCSNRVDALCLNACRSEQDVFESMPTNENTPAFGVTVIIAAYRATGFIKRAIDSALSQNGVSVQVIVVDDCCPLGTGEFVTRRYQGFDNVHVITLGINKGPSHARNVGIKYAEGCWVAILDADDAFEQGRLARLIDFGEAVQAAAVADNVRYYDPVSGRFSRPAIRRAHSAHQVDIYEFVDRARPGTGELDFGLLKPVFRRSALGAYSEPYPVQVRHGEDFLFYFQFILDGGTFFLVPEVGYNYTERSAGLSQTKVDYPSLCRDTLNLGAAQFELGDRRLSALLRKRALSLDRLDRERRLEGLIRKKAIFEILAAVSLHPSSMLFLARLLKKRLLQKSF